MMPRSPSAGGIVARSASASGAAGRKALPAAASSGGCFRGRQTGGATFVTPQLPPRWLKPHAHVASTSSNVNVQPLMRQHRALATSVGEEYFGASSKKDDVRAAEHSDFVVTNRNVQMPRLIYGTAWKEDQTADLVVQAVKVGFRGIDTACQPKHYREELVGEALTRLEEEEGILRKDLFLQTKFTPLAGQDLANVPYGKELPLYDQVMNSFAVSLTNLRTPYVDSLVLHSPCDTKEATLEVWRAMEEIVDAGGARQLGISNCSDVSTLQDLYDAARIKPSVVQNRFYRETGFDVQLRQWCASLGIRYQSFWTLTANPTVLEDEGVRKLAQERERTPEQIFLRFAMDDGVCPLSGAKSLEHMKHGLQAVKDAPLSDTEGAAVVGAMFKPKPKSSGCQLL